MSSGTGGAKEQVDVYLDDDLLQQVESQLEYGDSLSGWIRDATRMRLNRDNAEN
jgi:metal-responsive CopG/Arc/MetJ family transcriptional regulator